MLVFSDNYVNKWLCISFFLFFQHFFREVKNNDQLLQVMQDQEKNRQDLVTSLRQDEQLQKAVVAALLERSDARSWSIVQQVNLVQLQLAALTNIELERKKLEINQQIVNFYPIYN